MGGWTRPVAAGEVRTAGELSSVEVVILAHVSCIVNDGWYD